MKNPHGFTDANNVWPVSSGARKKPSSMARKPSNTSVITTPKSLYKTCSIKPMALGQAILNPVRNFSPAIAEILMVQFILHLQFLFKPEIEFKIIKPGDRWFYPL